MNSVVDSQITLYRRRRRRFLLLLLFTVEHLHKLPVADVAVLVLVDLCQHLLRLPHAELVTDVGDQILEVLALDAPPPRDVQGPEGHVHSLHVVSGQHLTLGRQ